MNRRDFVKIAGLAGLASLFPFAKLLEGMKMSTLTELIMKMADNQPLNPLEREELRQVTQEIDDTRNTVKTWQRVQDKQFNTNYLDLPFVPIVSQVFEQDMAEYTIQIPSQYNNLLIMGQGRGTGTGVSGYLFAQFNGDTGGNYVLHGLRQAGTLTQNYQNLTGTSVPLTYIPVDDGPANHTGTFLAFLPHYNSGFYKSVIHLDGTYSDSTYTEITNTEWKNITPIQTIRFFPDANNIKAGSLISVYGIK